MTLVSKVNLMFNNKISTFGKIFNYNTTMKKNILYLALFAAMITSACKQEKKTEQQTEPATTEVASEMFVIKPEATTVSWTGYKTTAKTPVKGEFTVLNFEEKSGTSPMEAINNLNFSIPVSSIFSKDESRDSKLKEFFFGAMENTNLLEGKLNWDNDKCIATITMNGVTQNLPLDFKIEDERRLTLKGVMNLEDWNALEAVESINKACFDLHKGEDGVSKTWSEVAIEVSAYLRKG